MMYGTLEAQARLLRLSVIKFYVMRLSEKVVGHKLVFEHGIVFDNRKLQVFSSLRARKGYERKLGSLKSIEVVTDPDEMPPDTPFEQYVYFDTAPRVISYKRRARIKKAFKNARPGMVTSANSMTKQRFLEFIRRETESTDSGKAWLRRLGELGFDGPGHFWRAVRGTLPIPDAVPELDT